MNELQPITFPPAVLGRISPELSLQRHLAIGVRPCLRTFNEFRPIDSTSGSLSRYANDSVQNSSILGSSVVRSGNTTVICTISGGIVEEDLPAELINEDAAAVNAVFAKESTPNELAKNTLDSAASVYPVVEVERGRVGAPTDEEMILSQRLYETVLHSGILDKDSLKVKVGLRSLNDKGEEMITYLDEDDEFGLGPKRSWRYVLYAKLKVFSRSGPLFDLVWCSLINALKDTKLPKAFIDENAADIKIPVKIRGNFGTIREQYQITCDPIENDILLLNQEAIGFASNFGIVDVDDESRETVDDEDKMELDSSSVLLIDIEGEEEETTAQKTISIVVDANGDNLKSATLIGAVDSQKLKQAIQLAKLRSKNLLR